MIWVTAAKPLGGYRVWVQFSDATEGEVELADLIQFDARPIVRALQNPMEFAQLRVEMDTVVWANGFDLAPEFLYARRKVTVVN